MATNSAGNFYVGANRVGGATRARGYRAAARRADAARHWLLLCGWAVLAHSFACGAHSEKVSTDVCLSGRRWTGGDVGNEEMSPGTDCVGCHLASDGPPFIAAGTVYGALDNQSQIERGCYGLEGVQVELEGADGRILRATTNIAGNFFIDGDPEILPKPYVARFRYTFPDGTVVSPEMAMPEPSYGGCARCHDGRAAATPSLDMASSEYVEPAAGLFVE